MAKIFSAVGPLFSFFPFFLNPPHFFRFCLPLQSFFTTFYVRIAKRERLKIEGQKREKSGIRNGGEKRAKGFRSAAEKNVLKFKM